MTATSFFEQIPMGYVAAIGGGLILLFILTRLPFVGRAIRMLVWLGLMAALVLVISERASLDPYLSGIAGNFKLDRQEVSGREVRIRMAPDGHFYAKADIDGAERRMLIDSGATITAIAPSTAAAAGVKGEGMVPVVLQTANGAVPARPGTVKELRVGNIVARNLRVVVSPGFGEMNVLGMNFLSKLKSWRVEGKTLILVPNNPQPAKAGSDRDQVSR
jgi:aspartyl protease family protein